MQQNETTETQFDSISLTALEKLRIQNFWEKKGNFLKKKYCDNKNIDSIQLMAVNAQLLIDLICSKGQSIDSQRNQEKFNQYSLEASYDFLHTFHRESSLNDCWLFAKRDLIPLAMIGISCYIMIQCNDYFVAGGMAIALALVIMLVNKTNPFYGLSESYYCSTDLFKHISELNQPKDDSNITPGSEPAAKTADNHQTNSGTSCLFSETNSNDSYDDAMGKKHTLFQSSLA